MLFIRSTSRCCLLLLFALTVLFGCDPPPRPPLAASRSAEPQRADNDSATPAVTEQTRLNERSRTPGDAFDEGDEGTSGPPSTTDKTLPVDEENRASAERSLPPAETPLSGWETWDAYFIGDEPIGFAHVRAEPISGGRTRYELRDQMTLQRGSSALTHQIIQQSIEGSDGRLQSFEATLLIGPAKTQFVGRREGEQLTIEVTRGLQRSTRQIAWKDDCLGLLGVQQSLLRKPLAAGERRQIETLLPVHYEVGEFQLQATAKRSVPLLDGTLQALTEINSQLSLGPNVVVDSYLWIDDAGNTLKSYTPALNLTAYRTDQATATTAVQPRHDLLTAASIQIQGRLRDPLAAKAVRFRLRPAASPSGSPGSSSTLPKIPAAAGQQVQSDEETSAVDVKVVAGVDTDSGLPAPTAADTAANPLIESDHPRIRAMAKAALIAPAKTPRGNALQLTGFVRQFIKTKDYSRGFSTASEVAKEATGDCTEHAVLLAALLRSQQIPARLVAGLTWVDTAEGPVMMYHLWTVAFVDGGWLPLDATLGGVAPASRIALVTTDLASGNEYECFSPILGIMGRVEIELVPQEKK